MKRKKKYMCESEKKGGEDRRGDKEMITCLNVVAKTFV